MITRPSASTARPAAEQRVGETVAAERRVHRARRVETDDAEVAGEALREHEDRAVDGIARTAVRLAITLWSNSARPSPEKAGVQRSIAVQPHDADGDRGTPGVVKSPQTAHLPSLSMAKP